LENGDIIEATEDHPFFIEDENGDIIEKKLKDLKDGDYIVKR
jgi:intein/homing endonuclease